MHAISQAARVTARGTGCNTPSRANSKHSSAARKQDGPLLDSATGGEKRDAERFHETGMKGGEIS